MIHEARALAFGPQNASELKNPHLARFVRDALDCSWAGVLLLLGPGHSHRPEARQRRLQSPHIAPLSAKQAIAAPSEHRRAWQPGDLVRFSC